ncbi:hypothetical protein HDU76_009000, partial [Blyttiomyces sp. JEL0837]
ICTPPSRLCAAAAAAAAAEKTPQQPPKPNFFLGPRLSNSDRARRRHCEDPSDIAVYAFARWLL